MAESRVQPLRVGPGFAVDRERQLEAAMERVPYQALNHENAVGGAGAGSIYNERARRRRFVRARRTARGSGRVDVAPWLAGGESRFLPFAGRNLEHILAIAWMLLEAVNDDGNMEQVVYGDVKLGA